MKMEVGMTVMVRQEEGKPIKGNIVQVYRGHRAQKAIIQYATGWPDIIAADQIVKVFKK